MLHKMLRKTIKLGEIGVDSGTFTIGDPCYYKDYFETHTWEDFCNTFLPSNNIESIPGTVTLDTPHGDGVFPVYGNFNKAGELVSVTIKF